MKTPFPKEHHQRIGDLGGAPPKVTLEVVSWLGQPPGLSLRTTQICQKPFCTASSKRRCSAFLNASTSSCPPKLEGRVCRKPMEASGLVAMEASSLKRTVLMKALTNRFNSYLVTVYMYIYMYTMYVSIRVYIYNYISYNTLYILIYKHI